MQQYSTGPRAKRYAPAGPFDRVDGVRGVHRGSDQRSRAVAHDAHVQAVGAAGSGRVVRGTRGAGGRRVRAAGERARGVQEHIAADQRRGGTRAVLLGAVPERRGLGEQQDILPERQLPSPRVPPVQENTRVLRHRHTGAPGPADVAGGRAEQAVRRGRAADEVRR